MNASAGRSETLQALTRSPLDVLVIGGGIVGSGVARDAALRGLRVGLVEQHDFAFGTSSRSSRLLHGGMRYLAQGRLGLVREASVEKGVIHRIAPHLAEPLPFIFPAYRGNRHWVLWQLKIGVKIYDLLCGGRNLGKSSWLSRGQALEKVPGLQAEQLKGAVRYFDGFTNDARLTLDTLRSAAAQGALLANYCRFVDGKMTAADGLGTLWECRLSDAVTGESLTVKTRSVVNATGPWADGLPHSRVHLRITKGIHVVVDRARLPVPETVVMTEGKRILFAIPWGERTILGTTDTDYQGPLDEVQIDQADIDYVLQVTGSVFPGAKLRRPDVISAWAGLRPLIADPSGKPSDISRSHQIRNPEPGWWDVAGGKLTTYRLMAEQTIDRIVDSLKANRHLNGHVRSCRTAEEPLLPAEAVAGVSGILPPPLSRDLVRHFCAQEWAVHLDDIMLRRTSWQHYLQRSVEAGRQVADWMAEFFGWPAERREAEWQRYQRAISTQAPLSGATHAHTGMSRHQPASATKTA